MLWQVVGQDVTAMPPELRHLELEVYSEPSFVGRAEQARKTGRKRCTKRVEDHEAQQGNREIMRDHEKPMEIYVKLSKSLFCVFFLCFLN